jgi:hypothetical protein
MTTRQLIVSLLVPIPLILFPLVTDFREAKRCYLELLTLQRSEEVDLLFGLIDRGIEGAVLLNVCFCLLLAVILLIHMSQHPRR